MSAPATRSIIIDGREIKILADGSGRAAVGRSRGRYRPREHRAIHRCQQGQGAHRGRGRRRSIISAPAKGEDITIVLGVNEDRYDPTAHHVISNASSHDQLPGARRQGRPRPRDHRARADEHDPQLHQRPAHPRRRAQGPPRRARSAGQNIIPTTTGAAKALGPRHPRPQGQVRRVQPARPDPDRQRRRLHRDRQPPDLGRGTQ